MAGSADISTARIRLASQLPRGVACDLLPFDEKCDFELFPSEQVSVERAVERRRRDFAAGRHCARRALARLGLEQIEIPSGQDRAPVWPFGIVGSISHCDGLAMAAVAANPSLLGLGVDCEVRRRVPKHLGPTILHDDERYGAGLPLDPGGEWLTAVFSAKEAVFKAIYPTIRQIIEFQAVRIRFTADGAHFQAEVLGAAWVGLATTQGVLHFEPDHVLTAAWLNS